MTEAGRAVHAKAEAVAFDGILPAAAKQREGKLSNRSISKTLAILGGILEVANHLLEPIDD